ncbi:hypothetical protein [Actinophytocola xanthii]|uniref:DUF3558 domain-containing protein n=1 Tax=Actinophytocola xanthii TaxID=1912961 RepID=A0A1Q8C1P1_9PSEU|nr:hypothetical protein [Actinophytocola xanthii]OLF08283.1 hypothetical protein BU204_34460 [Actinophytocola xanthii]
MTRLTTIRAVAVLVATVSLAGCGETGYEGTGTAACPALPADVVAAVAGNLSASGEGYEPDADDPEGGSLPARSQSDGGILYRCRWATTEGGAGITVFVTQTSADRVAEVTTWLREQRGPDLTAGASGYGRALYAGGDQGAPHARWACGDRVLEVDLDSPKDGTDALQGVKRLAEALVPKLGCPPS